MEVGLHGPRQDVPHHFSLPSRLHIYCHVRSNPSMRLMIIMRIEARRYNNCHTHCISCSAFRLNVLLDSLLEDIKLALLNVHQ